jgi:hypothetical protein
MFVVYLTGYFSYGLCFLGLVLLKSSFKYFFSRAFSLGLMGFVHAKNQTFFPWIWKIGKFQTRILEGSMIRINGSWSLIKSEKVVVISFASMKQKVGHRHIFIKKLCPRNFYYFAFRSSVGRSGGMLTIWDSSFFSGNCVFQNEFSLSVELVSTNFDIS